MSDLSARLKPRELGAVSGWRNRRVPASRRQRHAGAFRARSALADERPFEAERYEVTSHFAVFGESVSKASVTVRVSNAFRSESEQGTGSVDALERSLRQCRYTLFPAIADELEGSARSVARMLW